MSTALASAEDLLEQFSRQRVLVVGDVMLDWFIWGSVSRISPEAPVPVVEVKDESLYPGGAANVARNMTPFGANVSLAGLFGNDRNGGLLQDTLSENGIGTELCLEVDDFQTITKTRVVALQQQVVRIDREKRYHRLTAAQETELLGRISVVLPEIDGIIIEDYGKGLITAEFVAALLEAASEHAHLQITVDPKPGNPIPWRGVTTVKPNRSEAFACAGMEDIHREDGIDPLEDQPLLACGVHLLEKWQCRHVLLTLGELGMLLFTEGGDQPVHIPALAKEVFDVSGAGDTAIAIYTLGLCSGLDAATAAQVSNLASSIVVGKLGTTPVEKEELALAVDRMLGG